MGDGRSGKREDEEEGIFQGAEQSGAPCPCLGKGENHIVGMCIVKARVGGSVEICATRRMPKYASRVLRLALCKQVCRDVVKRSPCRS